MHGRDAAGSSAGHLPRVSGLACGSTADHIFTLTAKSGTIAGKMLHQDDEGSLLIPLIIVIVLFLGAAGFAVWAFMGRQDYKNNVDQKVTAAVSDAVKKEDDVKNKAFAEQEKKPLKPYTGPTAYGTLKMMYPKTWSAYINQDGSGDIVLDGYLMRDFVPNIAGGTAMALRVQISRTSYDVLMKQLDSQVKGGRIKVAAYRLPQLPGILGSRIEGQITPKQKGSLVLIPMRDKTLKIWTEGTEFAGDFDTIILPNVSFIP
jgi:hypothetical protein